MEARRLDIGLLSLRGGEVSFEREKTTGRGVKATEGVRLTRSVAGGVQ
jgi:hypothetical protein